MNYLTEIVNQLAKGKCIMLIGPELNPNLVAFEAFYEEMYQQTLAKDTDGMVIFSKKSDKLRYIHALEKFYETHTTTSELLRKIASLPTHIIVSGTPDYALKHTFDAMAFPYQFMTYHKLENPKEIEKPSVQKPLIYNLFGEINEPQSLILTFNDLTEFLFNVKAKHQLPNNLKISIAQTRLFLFLGFDLEKWYMKVLFHLLQLHQKEEFMAMPYSDGASVKQHSTRNFYIENFEVQFFEEDAQTLIHQLYEAAQAMNCLRQNENAHFSSFQKKAIQLLKQNQIIEVIELLENHFEAKDEEMYQAMILKSGELARLERNYNKSLLTREEFDVQLNRIKDALLNFVMDIETTE